MLPGCGFSRADPGHPSRARHHDAIPGVRPVGAVRPDSDLPRFRLRPSPAAARSRGLPRTPPETPIRSRRRPRRRERTSRSSNVTWIERSSGSSGAERTTAATIPGDARNKQVAHGHYLDISRHFRPDEVDAAAPAVGRLERGGECRSEIHRRAGSRVRVPAPGAELIGQAVRVLSERSTRSAANCRAVKAAPSETCASEPAATESGVRSSWTYQGREWRVRARSKPCGSLP